MNDHELAPGDRRNQVTNGLELSVFMAASRESLSTIDWRLDLGFSDNEKFPDLERFFQLSQVLALVLPKYAH